MFKALWPKRMISGAAQAPADTPPGTGDAGPEHGLVARLTHTSAYHLERLEKLLQLRFHKEFGTLDDGHLRGLIHYASRVQDADIQRELLLFYLNCPPAIQSDLRSGDTVDENHVLHQAPKPWL